MLYTNEFQMHRYTTTLIERSWLQIFDHLRKITIILFACTFFSKDILFLISVDLWQSYSESFSKKSLAFEENIPDLIDLIWTDRPELGTETLLIHSLEYAGKSWQVRSVFFW